MQLYHYAEEHELELNLDGIFIRIGEDLNENEVKYFGEGYQIASINREIIINEDL